MNTTEIQRIPRPKGITNTARATDKNATYDRMIGHYLKGHIPAAVSLSAYEFGLLYNIPDNLIQSRIKDGLVSELLQDGDLQQTLEAERLKLLSSSLHRIGSSDHELNRLLSYLASRVIGARIPNPELIKELNATIGTQVRLTETSFKAITLLNQALSYVIQDAPDAGTEDQLTREQILLELEKVKAGGTLDHYLDGTPNLEPHNLGVKERQSQNVREAHEFNKAEEVLPIPIQAEVIVLPR